MKRLSIMIAITFSIVSAEKPVPTNMVPGQLVVKLAPESQILRARSAVTGSPQLDAVLNSYGMQSVEPMFPAHRQRRGDLPDLSRIVRVQVSSSVSPDIIAREVAKLPNVLYAEPLYIRQIEEIPDDPQYGSQWHLSKIMASAAWDSVHGDSSVIVAIVDNGFDMDHPDLEANYFTNLAELEGTAGVDDDGNGYVDDVRGWDFAGDNSANGSQPDNDPNHGPQDGDGYWVHGTHVAGLTNAVTNNGIGVAGVAWNVRVLPVKAGFSDIPASIYGGYSGIVYAADMGAHIINNSWGGSGFSQYEEDVIDYAVGMGSLVVAAAGNANTDQFHGPSGYQGVMSVAATNSSDVKAGFSNYGITIDVSAPGVNTLATFPEGDYGSISGTSMASPITAGLLGLVKSAYPNLTASELAMRVAATSDNIDASNPAYIEQLGSGRINAFNAVTLDTSDFTVIAPRVDGWVVSFTDSISGDGNGILDRGEIIHVSGTFRNFSMGGSNDFSVRLSSDTSAIQVLDSTSSTMVFDADSEVEIVNDLTFQVADSAQAGMAELSIDIYLDGSLHRSYPFFLLIGKTPVLLVDDDTGEWNVEGYYTGILDEQGIVYGIWDRSAQGSPTQEVLNAFPIVVWLCEWTFPSLDEDDRSVLRNYLDLGGNLYLSGQDLGWDLNQNPGTEDQISFFQDYMHADWGGDHSGTFQVHGIPGDPISDGLSFNVWQPGYPESNQYPDYFTPRDSALTSFEYDNGLTMGLRYAGDYRLVYTGVGLEAFGSVESSLPPQDINNVQRTALTRILSYLNFIHHEPVTDIEDTTGNFEIAVDITGETSDLEHIILQYRTGNGSEFTAVAMDDSGNGRFHSSIPAPGSSTGIDYYIDIANAYYRWTNPVGAPDNSFHFYAGPDTVLPVILSVNQLMSRIDRSGSEEIVAYVTDNIGIDSVFLNWSPDPNLANPIRIPMGFDGRAWRADLTWGDLPGGTLVSYRIEARDNSSNQNLGFSDIQSFRILNHTRITKWEEEELAGWDTGDGWGIKFINALQGNGMNDSPQGQYSNNANNSLTMTQPVDLVPYQSAYLHFWNGAFLVEGEDFGYVEVSGNGTDWLTVSTITGRNVVRIETIDVTDFIPNGKVYIRFRMTSDGANTALGWFVDDIELFVDTTVTLSADIVDHPIPVTYALDQNYPNPFNPTTWIQFDIPQENRVRLTVYNLLGRQVRTLANATFPAGTHRVQWMGRNDRNELLGAGMYFYRLEAGSFTSTRKMVLLK